MVTRCGTRTRRFRSSTRMASLWKTSTLITRWALPQAHERIRDAVTPATGPSRHLASVPMSFDHSSAPAALCRFRPGHARQIRCAGTPPRGPQRLFTRACILHVTVAWPHRRVAGSFGLIRPNGPPGYSPIGDSGSSILGPSSRRPFRSERRSHVQVALCPVWARWFGKRLRFDVT